MQAVKDKLHDMNATRKAKAEARAEEKEEKDLAKARMDIAHEVRLAKEAEAAMELHVAKAGEKAEKEIAKHHHDQIPTDHCPPTTAAPSSCSGSTLPTSTKAETPMWN